MSDWEKLKVVLEDLKINYHIHKGRQHFLVVISGVTFNDLDALKGKRISEIVLGFNQDGSYENV